MKKALINLLIILLLLPMILTSCMSHKYDAAKPFPDESQPNIENTTSDEKTDSPSASEKTNNQSNHSDLRKVFSRGQCEERELVRLTAAPAYSHDLAYILPMGLMTGAHVTPVDHQYYFWDDMRAPLDRYSIHSPADGYVVKVDFLENDYHVVIEHSCDVYSIFIHLEQLTGPLEYLKDLVSWGKPQYVRIPVKAEETIAFDGGTAGFDFSVHNNTVILPGFINPLSYVVEPWKIHTVDPYEYFDEPVRSQLLTKNIRQIEPLGGKIDYDLSGRLIGNWFMEGSNGYQGISPTEDPILPDQKKGYWNTHLAIAHDPIDPSTIIVSLGWFEEGSAQLAVKEPDPLPVDVSIETGLVKYELWDWQYVHDTNGQSWHTTGQRMAKDIKAVLGHQIRGVVLFQLLDNMHLKMEAFPGLKTDEVFNFTERARIYER
jgi:hypothetical protein